jgi:hypothetical protein
MLILTFLVAADGPDGFVTPNCDQAINRGDRPTPAPVDPASARVIRSAAFINNQVAAIS